MGKLIDLTGQKFGRLTVICRANDRNKEIMWMCKCDCGNEKLVAGKHLRYGLVSSCGCLQQEDRHNHTATHRKSNTRIYKIWQNMRDRCYRDRNRSYPDYGGRGIRVCDEWNASFELFWKWATNNGYTDELTIDRIDNDGNYEPDNCRWIPKCMQAGNRRLFKNNTSGYSGVSLTCSNKYKVTISQNGKNKVVGTFNDIKDAVSARQNCLIEAS